MMKPIVNSDGGHIVISRLTAICIAMVVYTSHWSVHGNIPKGL